MLPDAFIKGFDQRRLKYLLAGLFIALALPTAVVIWQAYDQLKWESWYQYRSQAEALARQIDRDASQQIIAARSRNFGDYSFSTAISTTNIIQRSPLSNWPVIQDLPGVIGHFQVDPDGSFSTPVLPDPDFSPEEHGLAADELGQRQSLANEIRQVLLDNELVRDGLIIGGRVNRQLIPDESGIASGGESEAEDNVGLATSYAVAESTEEEIEADDAANFAAYEQAAFDNLNQAFSTPSPGFDSIEDRPSAESSAERTQGYGKIRDLRLDEALQKRSEEASIDEFETDEIRMNNAPVAAIRARAAPATAPSPPSEVEAGVEKEEAAITTFDSEIDPLEFNRLASGHLVLYRNAWRDGERFIQGMILDQAGFLRTTIGAPFRASSLAYMSNLVVGYRDDVIDVLQGDSYNLTGVSADELAGTLLYRTRLTAPFDSLELVFAITRLPPGPGASVLAWSTVVIAIVFLGGFVALYRLGVSQIRLAKQQQDFVSAVSHELKTPLTSIRMYGEMLKEGWADAEKQKQYYEFIHDESERLTRLISNVLQLASISRHDPQFELRPIGIATLLDQVRSKIDGQIERAGFQLEYSDDGNCKNRQINVDEDCFTQILINLVDNAIKFSKDAEHKQIDIGVQHSSDDQVVITVRDYGPGIPKSQLKKIFKLFYRTESELTRETVGTGIGLAIVHQLTTAMGGTIDVINKEPGVEFRLTFPG